MRSRGPSVTEWGEDRKSLAGAYRVGRPCGELRPSEGNIAQEDPQVKAPEGKEIDDSRQASGKLDSPQGRCYHPPAQADPRLLA